MTFQSGEIVDITIKGVEFAYERAVDHRAGLFSIRADDGRRYTMPPQAAITRTDDERDDTPGDDRIAEVLGYLDRLEIEGGLDPSVAATVREVCGLPPRHWPPRPGDVWHDGFPFGDSLWFVQTVEEGGGRSHLALVPVRRDADQEDSKTPEAWLARAIGPRLAYRREGDQ